jgi:y4mF family transcriptional regulator
LRRRSSGQIRPKRRSQAISSNLKVRPGWAAHREVEHSIIDGFILFVTGRSTLAASKQDLYSIAYHTEMYSIAYISCLYSIEYTVCSYVQHIRTSTDIGALIRDRRNQLGLNQQDLAARVGVGRVWISHLEQGKPTIQLGLVLRTLRELGLSLSSLDSAPVSRQTTSKSRVGSVRRSAPDGSSSLPRAKSLKSVKPVKVDLNKVIQGTLSSKR